MKKWILFLGGVMMLLLMSVEITPLAELESTVAAENAATGYPNSAVAILGTVLFASMIGFGTLSKVCFAKVDKVALQEKKQKGRWKRSYEAMPPAELIMLEWRSVAQFRDYLGYALAISTLYFIGRAVWIGLA